MNMGIWLVEVNNWKCNTDDYDDDDNGDDDDDGDDDNDDDEDNNNGINNNLQEVSFQKYLPVVECPYVL